MTVHIAMWSGPRNLSTAMMRSFGSRPDTFVSDEPFYGCFLKTSGAGHPMREETIASMDCDWQSVMKTLRGDPPDLSPVWYQKQMWHHMVGPIGYDDFAGFTHAFLIREPERMIASYLRKRESAAFDDFGLERQAEFFDREADEPTMWCHICFWYQTGERSGGSPRRVFITLCQSQSIDAIVSSRIRWPAPRSSGSIRRTAHRKQKYQDDCRSCASSPWRGF